MIIFEDMTIVQLRQFAEENEIGLGGYTLKSDIVKRIESFIRDCKIVRVVNEKTVRGQIKGDTAQITVNGNVDGLKVGDMITVIKKDKTHYAF